MQPYMEACEHLFQNEAFISGCSAHHVSSFLWFAFLSRWRHDASLGALGERILDPTVVDKCSPSSACRILATYTSLLSLPPQTTICEPTQGVQPQRADLYHGSLGELTTDLFHAYGGHLLTSRLSPAEVSSALYAYAKMSYCQDMGIFDHLVSLMATMSSADETSLMGPTVRQLTQSLWSCGRMIVWEADRQLETLEDLRGGAQTESDTEDVLGSPGHPI